MANLKFVMLPCIVGEGLSYVDSSHTPSAELKDAIDANDFERVVTMCETLEGETLQWLLGNGANPDCGADGTALAHVRADLANCMEVLFLTPV